jgi:hypothetical protein
VIYDLGDPASSRGSVHTRNKEQVGYRMALQVMHVHYAKQV